MLIKSVLAVSPTHVEGHIVTQAIRDELKERGLIDTTKTQACTSMKNQQWTDARRKEASRYEAGMTVFFNKPAPGFQAGSWANIHCVRANQVIVQDKQGKLKPLPLKLAERFQVYRPQQMDLAKGDILRFTQNTHGMLAGTKRKISNGTLCRINGFSPKTNNPIITPIDGGKAFEVSINNGHFTHGFCSTSHASQGKTVDHIFIAQASDSFPASNREQFYVSVSRGKQQAQIFTDNKADLLQAVDQSDPRTSAIELQRKPNVKSTSTTPPDKHITAPSPSNAPGTRNTNKTVNKNPTAVPNSAYNPLSQGAIPMSGKSLLLILDFY